MSIELNLEYLKKANKCKSTDTSRFYLMGVFVKYYEDKQELHYVATDGSIMYKAVETFENCNITEEEKELLKQGVILQYDFNKIKLNKILQVDFIKDVYGFVFYNQGVKTIISIIDTDYTDYNKVIPVITNNAKLNDKFINFNWKHLKIKEELGFDGCRHKQLIANDPVLFENENELLIIMPRI